MSNLALFVTHHIFLEKDEIEILLNKNEINVVGHCVPVWINAKTGKTTEPAPEIFCNYKIHNLAEINRVIEKVPKKGFEIYLPQNINWSPPPPIDYEKISELSSEERQLLMAERDKWWFNNPKPHCVEDLKNGYIRFEIKNTEQKIYGKKYSSQHIIEIASIEKLKKSLTV